MIKEITAVLNSALTPEVSIELIAKAVTEGIEIHTVSAAWDHLSVKTD